MAQWNMNLQARLTAPRVGTMPAARIRPDSIAMAGRFLPVELEFPAQDVTVTALRSSRIAAALKLCLAPRSSGS
jgi:hypothetical protein